ncbi:uncharacterized protein HMPREF1541_03827 [Cyphellophora europaea CBS 101466]|uniref:Alpha-N-acetylglucosaminidase n=1 Tax=Cyphellophora europaea (strain CBS 101466) TaxID=1220924 RepID=W2S1I0_CYPE1|nr:uncharacterized protein HMPREF1541_03827 [Cyphellophora europaea CBS 101466]ETN41888.1 hypothetical protein HMPREF1541_03827 [Cyphellophora europaea CBS 101466]
MLWVNICLTTLLLFALPSDQATTAGIKELIARRLPNHVDKIQLQLIDEKGTNWTQNDQYSVSSASSGAILVEGNSVSAIAVGLRRYLTEKANVDIYWYIGSRLQLAPTVLPNLSEPLTGSSVVPWRYHFNTVTFSYTTPFWSWEDWEAQLDWMSLHGINLPLAWVGQEKLLAETFRSFGFNESEISDYFSGPAFQAWNRFGNIQSDWAGELPTSWIDGQFELQKKIVQRMIDLGMTPILPAFTGFVPRSITHVYPNASVLIGSEWEDFSPEFTNVTFLNPSDNLELFTSLQEDFIARQRDAYGNVTHYYTLDQYNENDPSSGDLDFLGNLTQNTWQSLKAADPDAIWVMQAWLFHAAEDFWHNDRIEAYLGGVPDSDMLVLDLASDSNPQWQRTNSYFGKNWIWCQLHDYGGNLGLYGQVMNLTINSLEALSNSSSLVGFGLSMEAMEGNEIVYDLLLDQAWSDEPIDTDVYFHDWVTSRYNSGNESFQVPAPLYDAWDRMRTTVYNNTNVTAVPSVQKSLLELSPRLSGIYNKTARHGTTITYDPEVLVEAWALLYTAGQDETTLWEDPSYAYDVVDISRQILTNEFTELYLQLVTLYNSTSSSELDSDNYTQSINNLGSTMLSLLSSLDIVLDTNRHFRLSTWIAAAQQWADPGNENETAYFEYNARNQVTLWGPTGEINDYASRVWSGLVASYYLPRWNEFMNYISTHDRTEYNQTELSANLLGFSEQWQLQTTQPALNQTDSGGTRLRDVLVGLGNQWPDLFVLP